MSDVITMSVPGVSCDDCRQALRGAAGYEAAGYEAGVRIGRMAS